MRPVATRAMTPAEAPPERERAGVERLPLGGVAYVLALVWVIACIVLYVAQLIGIARG